MGCRGNKVGVGKVGGKCVGMLAGSCGEGLQVERVQVLKRAMETATCLRAICCMPAVETGACGGWSRSCCVPEGGAGLPWWPKHSTVQSETGDRWWLSSCAPKGLLQPRSGTHEQSAKQVRTWWCV